MRTFELRVYKLRTKEALDFYEEKIYPRHLKTFPLFGIEAHGFWTAKERVEPRLFVLASYGRAKIPARSFGGTCKAQNSLTTSETSMFPTSLALNPRFSDLQQVLRSNDGKRGKQLKPTTRLDSSTLRTNSLLFWCALVAPVGIIVIGINFILNPVGASTAYGIPIHDPTAFPSTSSLPIWSMCM